VAVTLKHIADQLGVSTQAVSLALHKPPGAARISAELRERIVATAHEMGYQPNRFARALVHGQSNFIGLLMLSHTSVPYGAALEGAVSEAAATGYDILLCDAHGLQTPQEQLQTFAESRVEGIISVGSSNVGLQDEVLSRKPPGVPMISINREVQGSGVLNILMDNCKALQQATEHLIRLGHRRIAYLDQATPPHQSYLQSSHERREGYRQAIAAAGFEPIIRTLPLEPSADQRVAGATANAHELLTGPQPPTAFCCVTDFEAIGALRACNALGLQVPEKVALYGFDDREAGQWTVPALSSVRQTFHEAGCLAVQRLLNWEEPQGSPVVRLDCELIFRGSAPALPPS
jgi:DNA-binding LacI/PurR family transcriptional regulator